MTNFIVAYERIIKTRPKTAQVSCFFAVSTFSELPEFITMLNAVIPIAITANGAAR